VDARRSKAVATVLDRITHATDSVDNRADKMENPVSAGRLATLAKWRADVASGVKSRKLPEPGKNFRASLTNNPRRLSDATSMLSAEGRRFADIFDGLAAEFPGGNPARLRSIALLKYELERAQAVGDCSLDDIVRVSNLIDKRERDLRTAMRRATSAPSPGLRQRLQAKHGGGP